MSMMDKYKYSTEVAAYGFGACLEEGGTVSDCFPLNKHYDNPYISGIHVSVTITTY